EPRSHTGRRVVRGQLRGCRTAGANGSKTPTNRRGWGRGGHRGARRVGGRGPGAASGTPCREPALHDTLPAMQAELSRLRVVASDAPQPAELDESTGEVVPTPGGYIREQRQRRGLSVEQLAVATKIPA